MSGILGTLRNVFSLCPCTSRTSAVGPENNSYTVPTTLENDFREAIGKENADSLAIFLTKFSNAPLSERIIGLFIDTFFAMPSEEDDFNSQIQQTLITFLVRKKDFDPEAVLIAGKSLKDILEDADARNGTQLVPFFNTKMNQLKTQLEETEAPSTSLTARNSRDNLILGSIFVGNGIDISMERIPSPVDEAAESQAPSPQDNASTKQNIKNISSPHATNTSLPVPAPVLVTPTSYASPVPSRLKIEQANTSNIALKPMAVLVVEDSGTIGKQVSRIVTKTLGLNSTIFWVKNHREALLAMQGKSFHNALKPNEANESGRKFELVILDFNLDAQFKELKEAHPNEELKSGFDVAREAYSNLEKSKRPIILRHTDTSETLDFADGSLNKPFNPSQLHNTLYNTMGSEWIRNPNGE